MRVDDYCHAASSTPGLSTAARLVLWVTAYHINRKKAHTRVGVTTIATETGLGRRRVQYALRELVDAGLLGEDRRPGRATHHRLPLAAVIHNHASCGAGAEAKGVHPVARGGAPGGAPPVHPVAPEPYERNHEKNRAAHPVLREACRCSAPGCDGFETTWHDDGFGRTFKIAEPCRHAEAG